MAKLSWQTRVQELNHQGLNLHFPQFWAEVEDSISQGKLLKRYIGSENHTLPSQNGATRSKLMQSWQTLSKTPSEQSMEKCVYMQHQRGLMIYVWDWWICERNMWWICAFFSPFCHLMEFWFLATVPLAFGLLSWGHFIIQQYFWSALLQVDNDTIFFSKQTSYIIFMLSLWSCLYTICIVKSTI